MEIQIRKTWETTFFEYKLGKRHISVELTLNHQNKTYSLCSEHQEHVSFRSEDNNIQEAIVKMKLVEAALLYAKKQLKIK